LAEKWFQRNGEGDFVVEDTFIKSYMRFLVANAWDIVGSYSPLSICWTNVEYSGRRTINIEENFKKQQKWIGPVILISE
jgi:hypothetical protein